MKPIITLFMLMSVDGKISIGDSDELDKNKDFPHLQPSDIQYLCAWLKQLIIVTSNKKHPAFEMQLDNLYVIYQAAFHPTNMLETLHETYQIDRITIQSGGTMNSLFLRSIYLTI